MNMITLKYTIFAVFGMIGSFIANLFGGWTGAMTTLLIFMGLDYLTGIIAAAVFRKSEKSEDGGLNSYIGWKGLCKKGVTLLIVLVAYRLDLLIGTQ